MKILITHPDFSDPGGVAGYFKSLEDEFSLTVTHFIIGKRPREKGFLSKPYRVLCDYYHFAKRLKTEKYDIIHLNPSLGFKSVVRDGAFLLLAKIFKKKIVVFFHGWQNSFELTIDRWFFVIFKLVFGQADVFIVLATTFKQKLRSWGFNQLIYTESTCINNNYLKDFDINKVIADRKKSKKIYILFLSRIIREKGIFETINAITILQKKFSNIELIIAGTGDELENVKSYVQQFSITNISFIGYIRGEDKYKQFEKANIFCFPSYSEGMPLAVVEAMSFGLPIITRPVGGIADFFINYKHGFCTTSKRPEVFADFIEHLILNEQLYEKISHNNYEFAQSRFLCSQSAFRLEKIYRMVLSI